MKGKSLQDIRRARGIENTAALDEAYRKAQLELPLAALRKASGVTQAEMAERLGKTQAAVSKFEGRGDFLCSTLFRYARSIGARIDLKVSVAGREFNIEAREVAEDLVFVLAEPMPQAEAGNVIEFKSRAQQKLIAESVLFWSEKRPSSLLERWATRPTTNNVFTAEELCG